MVDSTPGKKLRCWSGELESAAWISLEDAIGKSWVLVHYLALQWLKSSGLKHILFSKMCVFLF